METKRGGKACPRREGRLLLFCMHGGLLWEKELTGRRSAASSSQTTAAQKEETSWGWGDMSRSFSISLFTCLPLPFTEQTCARHMCDTLLSSRHPHKRLHARTGCGIHKILGRLPIHKQDAQNKPDEFWWNMLFVLLTWTGVYEE